MLSDDPFNMSPANLIVVLTTRNRGIPLHVEIKPPEGGVRENSYIMCENIRSVARERLAEHWGVVSERTLWLVEERLRLLLEII